MRIAINAVSAKSGGALTYMLNLAKDLPDRDGGHQYSFYAPPEVSRDMRKIANSLMFRVTEVPERGMFSRLLWDQHALRSAIQSHAVDLLLSSSDFGMLFSPCPQILMMRNSLHFSRRYLEQVLPRKSRRFRAEFALRRWMIQRSAAAADLVMVASRSFYDEVRQFVDLPDDRIVVNPFGVLLGQFMPVPHSGGDSHGRCRLLYVSEYSDYKNLTTLLKAGLLLRERGRDDFCLVTTADPSQFPDVEISTREQDTELASHPLLAPCVRFTGSVRYEDIPKLYAQSDLFVFPSLAESFGHPLVEAMASGLPIIASDIPICREICGDAAVYFSPLDPSDLAEKIAALRKNPDLRRRLGQVGRKRAETHFDWKDHVRRLIEIIESVAMRNEG